MLLWSRIRLFLAMKGANKLQALKHLALVCFPLKQSWFVEVAQLRWLLLLV